MSKYIKVTNLADKNRLQAAQHWDADRSSSARAIHWRHLGNVICMYGCIKTWWLVILLHAATNGVMIQLWRTRDCNYSIRDLVLRRSITSPIAANKSFMKCLYLCFRCQATGLDCSKHCCVSGWVRNQRWRPVTGSEYGITFISACIHDSNEIPRAILMFSKSGITTATTALVRILSYVSVNGISKMADNNRICLRNNVYLVLYTS